MVFLLVCWFFNSPSTSPCVALSHVQHIKCSATVSVHKHYVYNNLRHLICQLCSFQYILESLCIQFVSEDDCNFVAHHVTTQLKINIVLLLPLRLYELGDQRPHAAMFRPTRWRYLYRTFMLHICCQSLRSRLQIAV